MGKEIKAEINRLVSNYDVALFWDYENVSLSDTYGKHNFLKIKRSYCEICCKKRSIDRKIAKNLINRYNFKITFTKGSEKNSSDFALKKSIKSFLNQNETKEILLISGDKHFKVPIQLIQSKNIKITLISRKESINHNRIKIVDNNFSVNQISDFPNNWWMNIPDPENSLLITNLNIPQFCPKCNNLLKPFRWANKTALKCSICSYIIYVN